MTIKGLLSSVRTIEGLLLLDESPTLLEILRRLTDAVDVLLQITDGADRDELLSCRDEARGAAARIASYLRQRAL